jgi:hypothetical protein
VNGTVFIDGKFTLDMVDVDVKYMGNGTIVANNEIIITAKTFGPFSTMQTANGLNHQNFPSNQVVGFVSPTKITLTDGGGNKSKERGTDPGIAGAFYCPAQIVFGKNVMVAGSVITNKMVGPGSGNNVHLRNSPNLKEFAPQSMPGRNDGLMGITKWVRR